MHLKNTELAKYLCSLLFTPPLTPLPTALSTRFSLQAHNVTHNEHVLVPMNVSRPLLDPTFLAFVRRDDLTLVVFTMCLQVLQEASPGCLPPLL